MERIVGKHALEALPMDVPELLDVLHRWFDDGGDPDTLRETVEMVINEREGDAGLSQGS